MKKILVFLISLMFTLTACKQNGLYDIATAKFSKIYAMTADSNYIKMVIFTKYGKQSEHLTPFSVAEHTPSLSRVHAMKNEKVWIVAYWSTYSKYRVSSAEGNNYRDWGTTIGNNYNEVTPYNTLDTILTSVKENFYLFYLDSTQIPLVLKNANAATPMTTAYTNANAVKAVTVYQDTVYIADHYSSNCKIDQILDGSSAVTLFYDPAATSSSENFIARCGSNFYIGAPYYMFWSTNNGQTFAPMNSTNIANAVQSYTIVNCEDILAATNDGVGNCAILKYNGTDFISTSITLIGDVVKIAPFVDKKGNKDKKIVIGIYGTAYTADKGLYIYNYETNEIEKLTDMPIYDFYVNIPD